MSTIELQKMVTGLAGTNLIKEFEGCKLKAYKCPAGIWTIGYGHTGPDVKENLVITNYQAGALLVGDLQKFENAIKLLVRVPLSQNQFDALVSFVYNVGPYALYNPTKPATLQASTLLKKLNAGDYLGAAEEFLRWDKVNGKPLAGLTKRRKAERELFLK